MLEQIKLGALISSLVYSFIGVFIFWFCFLLIDKLTPYNLWKELIDEHNVALAILLAGIALGICVIVASAIH
ncbi:MAG: DUF350 domain-containing protein [Deltaproteobacteria bacterium]|nr:DUF350 domain-containing protein [Deltaproteobacteria bacterium]